MKFTFKRADRSQTDSPAVLSWESGPLDSNGTIKHVFCDEDWFWASPTGRWVLYTYRTANGYDPGFQSYRMTPVNHNNTHSYGITDYYIS